MNVKELKEELEDYDDSDEVKIFVNNCPAYLAPLELYPFELNTRKPCLVLFSDCI